MAQEIIYSGANDNRVFSAEDATWATVRGAATGTIGTVTDTVLDIGEGLAAGLYRIRRAFLFFTSTLTGTVDSVIFSVQVSATVTNTMHVVATSQSDPVASADYNNLDFTSFGTFDPSTTGVKTVTLNAAGIAYVQANVGGVIKLGVIGNYDQTNSAPSAGNYYPGFYSGDEATNQKPKLTINYSDAGFITLI